MKLAPTYFAKISVRALTLGLALSSAILLAPNTSHGAAAGAGAVYWYNGNTLRNLTEAQLLVYTVGAIEGLVTGLDIADSNVMRARINKCTDGMTSGQLGKVFRNYLNAHPENWDDSAMILIQDMLVDMCEKRGRSILK